MDETGTAVADILFLPKVKTSDFLSRLRRREMRRDGHCSGIFPRSKHLGFERNHVAFAADRPDENAGWGIIDLAPQLIHVDIDNVGRLYRFRIPDHLE